MNCLLFSDPHFTDNPIEEYRWEIFHKLIDLAWKWDCKEIFCLGDLTDRKDRHSKDLVNKLVNECKYLQRQPPFPRLSILSGNHDAPLTGTYYWEFLNEAGVKYVTQPELFLGIYLLPFSSNPISDWANLPMDTAHAAFMHQTVEGAIVDGGRKIPSTPYPLPVFPKGFPIFSGDIHRPQHVGGITYVGTPYPIRFSETWSNRVIVIQNNDFVNFKEIPIDSIKRAILDIEDTKGLSSLPYKHGDQLRLRYKLSADNLSKWPLEENTIRNWAAEKGIYLASVESVLTGDTLHTSSDEEVKELEIMKPSDLLEVFGKDQKLSQDVINMGLDLLKLTILS